MTTFIVIARGAWGRSTNLVEAMTACRDNCGAATYSAEHMVYECDGPPEGYSISPIDGALSWRSDGPEPVRILHHRKGRKADRRRLTMAELRAIAARA
jgi:hypothetical protein